MNETQKVRASEPDEWVIERVRHGEEDALDALITRHRARAVRLAEFYLHDESQAYEIAQKAFTRTILSIDKLRTSASFLARLTKNIIALSAKSNFASSPNSSQDTLPSAEDTKLPEKIYTILADMPEDLRAVITLRDICGLSYGAIAKVLYLPEFIVAEKVATARRAFSIHFNGDVAACEEAHDELQKS